MSDIIHRDASRREHTSAVLVALLVTVLWSWSWILIRWGLDDEGLDPLVFAGVRYLIASFVLAALVASTPRFRRELRALPPRRWGLLIVLGLVFVTAAQGAQFVAIDSQPAASSSLVLALTPLLVTGVSTLTLGERPVPRQIAGVILILLGAVAYFSGELGFTALGLAASIVALLANAVAAILGRGINRERSQSPLVVTVVSMMTGAVVLLVVGVVAEGVPSMSGRAWLIVSWLAVVNTALAFTLWNRSLRSLSATESAAINNTMLVQIAVLAWVFLGENPGLLDIAGMLAVSIGVYMARSPRSEYDPGT